MSERLTMMRSHRPEVALRLGDLPSAEQALRLIEQARVRSGPGPPATRGPVSQSLQVLGTTASGKSPA
jgi:hypothetical protein